MSKYAILVCFLACTVSVAAQESVPSIPDVDEWKADKSFNLDPKIDNTKIAFLGEVKEYRNPRDPNEFVRKVSKHLALISMRRLTKQNEHFMFIDVTKYHRRKEIEVLEEVRESSDVIAYVRGRVLIDAQTEQEVLVGNLECWLRKPDGTWHYSNTESLRHEIFSEPIGFGEEGAVLVGIKFSLGDVSHVIRLDVRDLIFIKNDLKKYKNIAGEEQELKEEEDPDEK
jgi:hypothetical protein